jgi:site-specific recombinase XerD
MSLSLTELTKELLHFVEYLRTAKGSAAHTCRSYEADLSLFIGYWQGAAPEEQLSDSLIEHYLKHVESKSMHVASIARKVSCFNSLRKYLAQTRGYPADTRLRRPHVPGHPIVYLSGETLERLMALDPKKLATPQPYRDRAIISLLASTGITCSELVNLKIGEVFIDQGTLCISGKRGRSLEIAAETLEHLKEYLKKSQRMKADADAPLFANPRGGSLTSRTIQRICTIVSGHQTIQQTITPHILRHSYAMQLLKNNVPQRVIQERLGFKTRTSSEKYLLTPR